MTRLVAVCISCVLLAGCGADGEPHSPAPAASVTTDATIGVGVGSSGTRVVGALGVNMGPVRIGVGF
jgi:hypothetical protein